MRVTSLTPCPLPRQLRIRVTRPRCEYHGDLSLVPIPMKAVRQRLPPEHSRAAPRSAICTRSWTPAGLQRDGKSPEPNVVLTERSALPLSSRVSAANEILRHLVPQDKPGRGVPDRPARPRPDPSTRLPGGRLAQDDSDLPCDPRQEHSPDSERHRRSPCSTMRRSTTRRADDPLRLSRAESRPCRRCRCRLPSFGGRRDSRRGQPRPDAQTPTGRACGAHAESRGRPLPAAASTSQRS